MFTLLADAIFNATLTNRGDNIPEHLKPHADRYTPENKRNRTRAIHPHNPYRDLW